MRPLRSTGIPVGLTDSLHSSNMVDQRRSRLKLGLMRAAARRRRADDASVVLSDGEILSATAAAAIEFTSERPGLSEPQKDRVAEIIAVLDKLTEPERDLIKAMVTDGQSEWPQMTANMPIDTQPDDVARASLYYSIEAGETERRRSRRFQFLVIVGGALSFLATWALQIYVLLQLSSR
jgi:hypothetical protein